MLLRPVYRSCPVFRGLWFMDRKSQNTGHPRLPGVSCPGIHATQAGIDNQDPSQHVHIHGLIVQITGLTVQISGHSIIKKAKVKALQGLYLLTKRAAHTARKAHDKPKIWLLMGARGLEPPNLTDVNRAL